MQNAIIYLIGFAGTGKYTIAKEICRLTDARLVDNHLINNPVFSLIRADGKTPLPESVWEKAWAIRHIVLDVIKDISPKEFSFVFTNVLVDGESIDAKLFAEIVELANSRNSKLVPVRLLCDEDELCRRVQSSDRATRFKDMNAETARHRIRSQTVLSFKHPNLLDLDVTNLSALQAAEAIIASV
jgi:cytidylate kinase